MILRLTLFFFDLLEQLYLLAFYLLAALLLARLLPRYARLVLAV